MNKNHRLRQKVISSAAAGLAVIMGAMQICTVQVCAEGKDENCGDNIYKEETVYVTADASGKQTDVIVSDWLKNAGKSSSVRDQSILDNIENVKGDETYSADGDSLIWETQDEDIFYQGSTQKQLPVSVSLTWYLDGKEISPQELNGKSGSLRLQIDYRNDAAKTVSVNGKQENVYTPFVMMTGIIFPGENCSDVEIDNGRVISDGDRDIVIGLAMPGMRESLGLEKEDNALSGSLLPESLNITAEVKNFTVPATYTLALSDLLKEVDVDGIADTADLEGALDDLEDAALRLAAGAGELSDGAAALSDGVDSYTEGVDQISRAVSSCLEPDGELNGQVKEYVNGIDTVTLGVQNYVDGAEKLADGTVSYIEGTKQLSGGASQLTELADGLGQVQSALEELSVLTDGKQDNDGGKDLKAALQSLADGTEKLNGALGSDAAKALISQVESMAQTGRELAEQTQELNEEMQQGIAEPVENIAYQLDSLSGELQKMTEAENALENACGQVNAIIDEDNAKISAVKEKGSSVQTVVNDSISKLEVEKEAAADQEAALEIQEAIDTLKTAADAAGELGNLEELNRIGTEELGTDLVDAEKIKQSADMISESMKGFSAAAEELDRQLPELVGKMEDIAQSADALPDSGMEGIAEQITQLNDGMQMVNAAVGGNGGLCDSIGKLSQSVDNSFPAAVQGINALNSGFTDLAAFNEQLETGAYSLKEGGKALTEGAGMVGGGTRNLVSGLQQIGSQMETGTSLLAQNSGQLRSGASALKEGAGTLADSMNRFESEGTGRLKSTVEEQLGNVLDRLKALDSPEAAYDTFSGKDPSMEGNVKFIIETEAGK